MAAGVVQGCPAAAGADVDGNDRFHAHLEESLVDLIVELEVIIVRASSDPCCIK
jgi:hypothetical protein